MSTVGEIASIDRGWIPTANANSVMTMQVGEIASIDRGWILTIYQLPISLLRLVGEIASIDRGWIPGKFSPALTQGTAGRRNSLD